MDNSVKRVIILGASGQIGSALYKFLSATPGFTVTGTSRKKNLTNRLIAFNPFKDAWLGLGKADVLVNCIGSITESSAAGLKKVHEEISRIILKNRNILGNPRIIQISALGADPDHYSLFLRTKGVADRLLADAPDICIVRPSIVCTSGTVLVKKIRLLEKILKLTRNHLIMPLTLPDTRIQPVLISDLLFLINILCSGEISRQIINVGGPEHISIRQLFSFNPVLADASPVYVNKKFAEFLVKWLVSVCMPFIISYEQYRLLFDDNVTDITAFKNSIGRDPFSTIDFWKEELG